MQERHRFERELADLSLREYDQAQPMASPAAGDVFSLPAAAAKVPDDRALRAELRKIGTKDARTLDAAFASVGKRAEFEKALILALKAVPLPGEGLNKFLIHLSRLGAEAFTLDISLGGDKRLHTGFVDHPTRLDDALTASSKEHFLRFAVKRLLDLSSSASTPEMHRQQMDRAAALFRVFHSELAREFRLIMASESLLLAYRSLLTRVIWRHYQALMDHLLANAGSSRLPFSAVRKELENHLRTASISQVADKRALLAAFRQDSKSTAYRDYFTPSSRTNIGFTYFSSKARPATGDGPEMSFQAVLRRRAEQTTFLEDLEKRSSPDPIPKLHDSASWQVWVRKMLDRRLLQRVDNVTEILGWVSRYFEAFTAHIPHDLHEGCKEKNYLTRSFPRAVTGSLIHDCGVYAVRWLHILGRLIAAGSTPPEIANPRIFLIEMPSHVGVMIRWETRFRRHILVSINNTQAVVHDLDEDGAKQTEQVAAQTVVQDMYQGMMTPFFVRPIKSRPSDARALWNEVCQIFDKKLRLPYSDPSEPHLRYLAHNAGIARISREIADTVGGLWIELHQRLDAAKNQSGNVSPARLPDEIQQYHRSVDKTVRASSEEYEKRVKPLIDEINSDLRADRHRLPEGTLVVETSPRLKPWESTWLNYRSELEKALKSRDLSKVNPAQFFRADNFRASVY